MAHHLVDLGHRDVAILAGQADVSPSRERIASASGVIKAAGGRVTVIEGRFTIESGHEGIAHVFELPTRPTAIFAINNFLTIGAMQALNDRQIRVPDEMTLVGFDDLPLPMVERPFLSVVVQPAYEMGRTAVSVLLDEIDGKPPTRQEIHLPTELLIRASSGPAPAR